MLVKYELLYCSAGVIIGQQVLNLRCLEIRVEIRHFRNRQIDHSCSRLRQQGPLCTPLATTTMRILRKAAYSWEKRGRFAINEILPSKRQSRQQLMQAILQLQSQDAPVRTSIEEIQSILAETVYLRLSSNLVQQHLEQNQPILSELCQQL